MQESKKGFQGRLLEATEGFMRIVGLRKHFGLNTPTRAWPLKPKPEE